MPAAVPQLPDELWLAVFRHLDDKTLGRMLRVNAQFRRVVSDRTFDWQAITRRRWFSETLFDERNGYLYFL